MEELEISVGDVIHLFTFINGSVSVSEEESVTGLLDNNDLSMVERFWLNDLNDTIRKIRVGVENLRDDMVRRRGKLDDEGNVLIKATEEQEIEFEGQVRKVIVYTPEFLKFQKDYNEVLSQKYTIKIHRSIRHFLPI